MTVTLNGHTFRVALTLTGSILVLRQQSRLIWRVASLADSARVLAGLRTQILRGQPQCTSSY